jgi:hypothetical protein
MPSWATRSLGVVSEGGRFLGARDRVPQIESLIFLLTAAALLAQLARLLKVPYSILLVLGALGLGFVRGLPNTEIPPR